MVCFVNVNEEESMMVYYDPSNHDEMVMVISCVSVNQERRYDGD